MCVCVHLRVGMANLSFQLMGNDDAGHIVSRLVSTRNVQTEGLTGCLFTLAFQFLFCVYLILLFNHGDDFHSLPDNALYSGELRHD